MGKKRKTSSKTCQFCSRFVISHFHNRKLLSKDIIDVKKASAWLGVELRSSAFVCLYLTHIAASIA